MKTLKTPRSLHLEITNFCNLRCKYCNHFTSNGDVGKDLPTEEWLQFFEELKRCAVMKVSLQGGEPLYRKDILILIEGIVQNRMRFNILSNGAMITDDIAAAIKATNRCDSIQVSVDGASPETHDVYRGSGSFNKAMEGIDILRRHGVLVEVRVSIHKQNVFDLEAVSRLLLEDIGLPSFSVNSVFYMGMCTSISDQLLLSTELRTFAMETLARLNRKYMGRIKATAGPLADAVIWGKMESARQQGSPPFENGGYLTACNCVDHEIGVRADGVMVPCNLLSQIELGRINRDPLQEVWQNHRELNRIRERRLIPLSGFEFCSGCGYIDYCTGNCPATAYSITGSDAHPSPDSCYRRFLNDGGCLPVEIN